MNKASTSTGVIEVINLALAIFSWLFSDIQFSIKVIITAVLVGIIVLSKLQPISWLNRLSIKPTVILFSVPIAMSIVMFHLAGLCYSKELLSLLIELRPLPLSFVYALLIGLPIMIISATLSNYRVLDLNLNLGVIVCILWFFSIYGLVTLTGDFNIWRMSLLGPIIYAGGGDQCALDSLINNDWIIVIVGAFLTPIVFYFSGTIWKSKNSLM